MLSAVTTATVVEGGKTGNIATAAQPHITDRMPDYPSINYSQPLLSIFLAAGFAGLLGRRLTNRMRRSILIFSVSALFLVSWPPIEWLLALPLEFRYRTLTRPTPGAGEAIVVLAGGGDPAYPELPVNIPGPSSYARSRYAAWLYRNWRAVPIVVSGGTHRNDRLPVSATMARVLLTEGVPAERVLEESRSKNTKENATFTAAMLRPMGVRRIALVVDADSMLRAHLCFRKEGIEVVPFPLGHRSMGWPDGVIPSAASIRGNEVTLHEALGIVWYKLRGWI